MKQKGLKLKQGITHWKEAKQTSYNDKLKWDI